MQHFRRIILYGDSQRFLVGTVKIQILHSLLSVESELSFDSHLRLRLILTFVWNVEFVLVQNDCTGELFQLQNTKLTKLTRFSRLRNDWHSLQMRQVVTIDSTWAHATRKCKSIFARRQAIPLHIFIGIITRIITIHGIIKRIRI